MASISDYIFESNWKWFYFSKYEYKYCLQYEKKWMFMYLFISWGPFVIPQSQVVSAIVFWLQRKNYFNCGGLLSKLAQCAFKTLRLMHSIAIKSQRNAGMILNKFFDCVYTYRLNIVIPGKVRWVKWNSIFFWEKNWLLVIHLHSFKRSVQLFLVNNVSFFDFFRWTLTEL